MRALLATLLLTHLASAQIPAHPDELEFPPLDFTPPMSEEYRHELASGVPVYLAPSDEFPLVTVSFTFKGGDYLDPAERPGLGSTLGVMMRRGGTTSVSAEEMDERFDFLAANVSSYVGGEQSGASLDCLTANFDEAFALFMDMLRNPGFDAERLRVHKDERIESFKTRNDNPMGVASPYMRRLLYGEDHYLARQATAASVGAITPDVLREHHARIFHPGNLLVSATGDFEIDEMLATLETALEGWTARERAADPPAPEHDMTAGLFHADVTQEDLPQGTTLIFSRGLQRDDPDLIPVMVMNDILGGGGFTSRITNRVRSDEGLAYSAASFMSPQVYYPGLFGAFFQSKNRTVALATKIIFEEIERIRTEPVSDEELEVTKNSFIEALPQRFASKPAMLGTFVNDELTGRDPGYWQSYREKVAAVDKSTVTRVARERLDPGSMSILVVGDWAEIEGGDLEGRASMSEFFDGDVEHLPMLDPLTREPMEDDVTP